MTKPETDAEFLERMRDEFTDGDGEVGEDLERLFTLADRSVKIPDDPTEAMIEAGYANKDVGSPAIVYRGIWRAMLTTSLKDTDK